MCESFIVDWQATEDANPADMVVSVRMRGRKAGLYRVKQVMQDGMLLSHGAISFPVGTQLDIDDPRRLAPGSQQHLRVVANDPSGLRLIAW
jgi:hypothetical protein